MHSKPKLKEQKACLLEGDKRVSLLGRGRGSVISLRERLSLAYPTTADGDIQELAIDLHDVAHGCVAIASYVSTLARSRSPEKVRDLLEKVDNELFDHLQRFHFVSLRRMVRLVRKQTKAPAEKRTRSSKKKLGT